MVISRNTLLLVLLAATALQQHLAAQSATGIRGYLDLANNEMPKGYSGSHPTFGFGIDHDPAERLSLGMDVSWALGESVGVLVGGPQLTYGSATFSTVSVIYRSAYCFRSNDDQTSAYFGPLVGYTRVSSELDQKGQGPKRSTTRTLIPLGLRFGVRGGLRGFYSDLFCTASYRLGANKPLFPGSAMDAADLQPRGFTFSVGLAIGVGWDNGR